MEPKMTAKIDQQQVYTLKFEKLTDDKTTIHKLTEFIGAGAIDDNLIEMFQNNKINSLKIFPNEPSNMQKTGFYPSYSDWDQDSISQLKAGAGKLSDLYGYAL